MATMDDVLQRVYDQRGQIDSLATLTKGIKTRLEQALAIAGSISPAQQAQIDKVFGELDANTAAITKAINANDEDPSNDPAPEHAPAPVEPAPVDTPSPVDTPPST